MPIRYFARHELITELGRGDTGIVYKARDPSRSRLVALKMLRSGARSTTDELRRFENEAQIAAQLDHPHIVPIFEVGMHDGQCYIVMKLIDGPNLDRKLGEFADDPKASARLVKTLAEAVDYVHQCGVLHLDLKPDNVVIDESGEPHLIDFGLAQRIPADRELIHSGAILGTPAYMSPEQASGQPERVTTATDVHRLGAILYALMTKRAPFAADSQVETLAQVRYGTPEPPSKRHPWISHDLELIVVKCLEKKPERRYCSAAALAEDLGRYLNGERRHPIAFMDWQ
jgi:eukaryotic-like serine/threonine-protein kinase